MKYRVEHLQDNTYQVMKIVSDIAWGMERRVTVYYQGSLSDCESWIRLSLNDEIDF